MCSELIELGRFPTSAEASIIRGQLDAEGIRSELNGEAVAGWLWHFGSAVGGVRVLISAEDADRAHEILGEIRAIDESEDLGYRSVEDGEDERDLPDELIKAWRASLIGLFLLPPLLNLYSTWLLIRNKFFLDRCRNWRVVVASVANFFVFAIVFWFIYMISVYEPEPQMLKIYTKDGQPVEPLHVEKHITIPIVPYD